MSSMLQSLLQLLMVLRQGRWWKNGWLGWLWMNCWNKLHALSGVSSMRCKMLLHVAMFLLSVSSLDAAGQCCDFRCQICVHFMLTRLIATHSLAAV